MSFNQFSSVPVDGVLFNSLCEKTLEELLEIIKNLEDINVENKDGETFLTFASRYGKEEFVELLLDRGANPNIQNKFGRTSLSYSHEEEIVIMLLEAGADPYIVDGQGCAALNITFSNEEMVKMLKMRDNM